MRKIRESFLPEVKSQLELGEHIAVRTESRVKTILRWENCKSEGSPSMLRMVIAMIMIFITKWEVGTFTTSPHKNRFLEADSWLQAYPAPTQSLVCCLWAPPPPAGAQSKGFFSSLLRLIGKGVAIHLPPRLELFVWPRDGIGGGPSTEAKTHWQLNHAKT